MQASHDRFSAFIEGSKTFVVPVYQRNYDWTVENCKQLFTDMTEAVSQNKSHFIGTIVHQKNSVDDIYQEYVIIDGQQRITSLILFARALCDFTDENLRDDLRSAFIVHTRGRLRGTCKLHPTEFDAPTFAKIINGDTNFTEDEKNSAMYRNFTYFRDAIVKSPLSPDKLQTALHKLNVVIICLDDEKPQEIFESLNSTGLDLTQADLIRNYLLMSLSPEQQETLYKNYWLRIEELLRPSGNVENFITQYMITRRKSNAVKHEQLSKQKLYAPFKNFFGKYFGSDRTEDFLRELLRYAKFFRRCIFDDSDEFNELPALEQKFYEMTYLLKATNAPIILMYLLNRHERGNFDTATFIKFVDALISLAFRGKVCKQGSIDQQFSGNVLSRLEGSPLTVENFWKAITFGKGGRPCFSERRDVSGGFDEQRIARPLEQKRLQIFPVRDGTPQTHVEFACVFVERRRRNFAVEAEQRLENLSADAWRLALRRSVEQDVGQLDACREQSWCQRPFQHQKNPLCAVKLFVHAGIDELFGLDEQANSGASETFGRRRAQDLDVARRVQRACST